MAIRFETQLLDGEYTVWAKVSFGTHRNYSGAATGTKADAEALKTKAVAALKYNLEEAVECDVLTAEQVEAVLS